MAYFEPDDHFPMWLPDYLPEEILAAGQLNSLVEEGRLDGTAPQDRLQCGYIIRDWFGPFMLGPATKLSRGQC